MFDSERARELRRAAGLGIEDLAAAAGVSPNTVRAAESGRHQPRPQKAASLAAALGVALEDLLVKDQEMTLRCARDRLGMTQHAMATRIGIARQMVSRTERGVGGVGSPEAWAQAYELTLDQWQRAHRASREAALRRVAEKTRSQTKPAQA